MESRILKQYEDTQPFIGQVTDAVDSNKRSFGFVPHTAYEEHALKGRLWVCADQNNNYCGHLLFGGKMPTLRVLQVYVNHKFRGNNIGQSLLTALEKYGEEYSFLSITARVAADLKANHFWESSGYQMIEQVDGGKTTGRKINVLIKALDVPSLLSELHLPIETRHTHLQVEPKATLLSSRYALDINVLLDVIKNRKNAETVQKLIGMSMIGNGQLCLTGEFVTELERNSHDYNDDPLLGFAKSLPVLPAVSSKDRYTLTESIAKVIFPERAKSGNLSENDYSDVQHVVQVIQHEITGFITSDKRVLRSSDELFNLYSIEILSPLDIISIVKNYNYMEINDLTVEIDGEDLSIRQYDDTDRAEVEKFLLSLGVNKSEIKKILNPGVLNNKRNRWVAMHGDQVLGICSWGGDELLGHRTLYLFVEEVSSIAQKLIDHFFEKSTNSLPKEKLSLLVLKTGIGNDLTRKTAVDRGFRKNSNIRSISNHSELLKVSYSGYISKSNWNEFKTLIKNHLNILLPDRIPTIEEFTCTGAVLKGEGIDGVARIPLFDIETFLSPAVFLCKGREAVIVPIKKDFIEKLLPDLNPQHSFFAGNEALMHVEKAYFKSAKNPDRIRRGDIMFFYVSGNDGGQEIIGHGRVTTSQVLNAEDAALKLQRQSALTKDEILEKANKNGDIHAITFDNFMLFSRSVSFYFLKQYEIVSKANLITAERINNSSLNMIINKGENRA